MMKKSLFLCAALQAIQICADAAPVQNKKNLPYDYDLFSKDRECEYVDLELLVLTLLNNQAVGAKNNQPSQLGTAEDPLVATKIKNMEWQWRPGFRVTVGYFNAPKYWEVMGQYTFFYDKGKRHLKTPGTGSQQYLHMVSYLPQQTAMGYTSDANPITSIQASGDLYYNDLSTLVSRNFYPNPHLRLRVIGGLTSMWSHLTSQTKNTFLNIENEVISRFHTKYWGVGFRMGAGADWYWGKDFYLTGKVFWSIVTGRWNTSNKISLSDKTLITAPHDAAYKTVQNFQFLFGPSYQKSYTKTRLELFVGYEFNAWLNALTTYSYLNEQHPQGWLNPQVNFQDLVLTGVNIRLTLDF